MFRIYVCVLVLAVMCQAVIGQDEEDFPAEWEASQLPNPVNSPSHCGIGRTPGFVCDPNGILSPRSVEILNWLLRGFYDNDTICPCATYWCEQTRKGSHLSIAVVRKLKLAETFDEPGRAAMQAAGSFALELQEERWNFGFCDNDIVILFSLEDQVMVISYGKTIVEVLTVDVANYIQRLYRHYFRPNGDHFTGFVEIIRALRRVLNGYNLYDPNHAHFEQLVGGGSHVTSGVLATITLAFLSMFWSSE